MKIDSLSMSERHFLDAPPLQAANLRMYQAEAGDAWGLPSGGFLVAGAGWDGQGPPPGAVATNRGAALVAWSANRLDNALHTGAADAATLA